MSEPSSAAAEEGRGPADEAGPEGRDESGADSFGARDESGADSAEQGRTGPEDALERGTYEILQGRLAARAGRLREGVTALNERRLDLFGAQRLELLATERIRTENQCVPRDILPVGDLLLFGYNVFLGLRRETRVEDVFSLHRFAPQGSAPHRSTEGPNGEGEELGGEGAGAGFTFDPVPIAGSFLDDARFRAEFQELYRYYREARLVRLVQRDALLLAVFQIGAGAHDRKVFRWSVDSRGEVTYVDNRGERDLPSPPSHDFEWTPTGREHQAHGRHPHVSILDEVFVETVGGDLTVKVEDNTEDGRGIYREPVDEPLQSLDDAQVHYARLGSLILFRVLPYKETAWRHFVFNTRTQRVDRIDAVGEACRQLPEDHGIIFPGGYYLAGGSAKTFDADTSGMDFQRAVRSPNGEDVLYVFYQAREGRRILLPYNLIEKAVGTPLACHGYSLFGDGRLVLFRALNEEPTRVHPMQIWQTPFVSDEHAARKETGGSFLASVGNAELVRGISDLLSLARQAGGPSSARGEGRPDPGTGSGLVRGALEELVAGAVRAADHYHWLSHDEAGGLDAPLAEVKEAAEAVLDELDKVTALRARAREDAARAEADLAALAPDLDPERWSAVTEPVEALRRLARQRGRAESLREDRHADLPRLDALAASLDEAFEETTRHAVDFLLAEDAFAPYHRRIEALIAEAREVGTSADARPLLEELERIDEGIRVLSEVITGLEVDDATVRTRLLSSISEVLGALNQARAVLTARRDDLAEREGAEEFGVQLALLSQAVAAALATASTPDKVDESLARLTLQIDELETRFGASETFLAEITSRREDVTEAFAARKQALVEERRRRARALVEAGDRILQGLARRAGTLEDPDELAAFFLGDSAVTRLRGLAGRLRELGAGVEADELESRLKTSRSEAARGLRDRRDLFDSGENLLRLGRHRFTVNERPLALTLVPHRQPGAEEEHLAYHLTGSTYYRPVEDDRFDAYRPFWEAGLPSESPEVYRGEYLAWSIWKGAERRGKEAVEALAREAAGRSEELLERVRTAAAERFEEGYERGVHDADAARILAALLPLLERGERLRYPPRARALAAVFWMADEGGADTGGADARARRERWSRQAASRARMRAVFGGAGNDEADRLREAVGGALRTFWNQDGEESSGGPKLGEIDLAADYLLEELARGGRRFARSREADELRDGLLSHLGETGGRRELEEDLRQLANEPRAAFELAESWVRAYLKERGKEEGGSDLAEPLAPAVPEAAALLIAGRQLEWEPALPRPHARVTGLLGRHPRIEASGSTPALPGAAESAGDEKPAKAAEGEPEGGGTLDLYLDRFLPTLARFDATHPAAFRAFQRLRHRALDAETDRLGLAELTPKVMSAFVRNRLIDQVYLPLIGDNLAKQIGAAGAERRTDQMGMLLLLSPPGYGKTTLMEYVAHRLGLAFVKANGPALGHDTTSLDPSAAPNATARREVERINFAFEVGSNVLLYLDDIQHTHPELLQRFISLADGTRRIEGVRDGRPRTYDLRGKRFFLAMAGNPYTESGERFRLPDMLANRADVYNLGDVLAGREEAFALSYIENSLTSNPVLAALAQRDPKDVPLLVGLAEGGSGARELAADQLSHAYSGVELEEILTVLRKLLVVRGVMLRVNAEYIASASKRDENRTEPPFRLQGSYRNMNKIVARVVPAMDESELQSLIDDHYRGEAQTLTRGAEENLLKLAELRGKLTTEEKERWEEIKRRFVRNQALGGAGESDPVARVTGHLALLSDHLEAIGASIGRAGAALAERREGPESSEAARVRLDGLGDELSAGLASGLSSGLASALASQLGPHLERFHQVLTHLAERAATARALAAPPAGNGADGGPETGSALAPTLDRLGEALQSLAAAPRSTHVVQTLSPGVHDLLGELTEQVSETLLPLVQQLARHAGPGGGDAPGDEKGRRRLGKLGDRTLKSLDQLRDLLAALRKLDTGGLASKGLEVSPD